MPDFGQVRSQCWGNYPSISRVEIPARRHYVTGK